MFRCAKLLFLACLVLPYRASPKLKKHKMATAHTLAPLLKMIMPKKKPKQVPRRLTQAQFRMGKFHTSPPKMKRKFHTKLKHGIPPPQYKLSCLAFG